MPVDPKRLSWSDYNAARYGMPGTQQQAPVTESIVLTPSGEFVDRVKMNYRGVAGGLPTDDPDALDRQADMYEEMGAFVSAQAARMRAQNIRGHYTMTNRTLKSLGQPTNIMEKLAKYLGL